MKKINEKNKLKKVLKNEKKWWINKYERKSANCKKYEKN